MLRSARYPPYIVYLQIHYAYTVRLSTGGVSIQQFLLARLAQWQIWRYVEKVYADGIIFLRAPHSDAFMVRFVR